MLKFKEEPGKHKVKEKMSVKKELIDKFDTEYLRNCDNRAMNRK